MSNNRDIQPEGQLVLLSAAESGYRIDVDRRNSVARLLTPEYLGMDPNDYSDITPEMVELAAPRNLRQSLIDVPTDGLNSVAFRIGHRSLSPDRRMCIAVTPLEYKLVVRNVGAIGRAVTLNTLNSRPQDSDFAAHTSAAERSATHMFTSKFVRIGQYVNNVLLPRDDLLKKFEEASRPKHVGLARFGNEGKMRQNFEVLRSQILADALVSIRLQRGWNPDKADLAERTIMKSIVLERGNNTHIHKHFRGLLALLQEHNSAKLELFTARGWELKDRLDKK